MRRSSYPGSARHERENEHYAALTDIFYKTWAGKSAREYRQFKGLKKESLRDNMTNTELVLNMLAENVNYRHSQTEKIRKALRKMRA